MITDYSNRFGFGRPPTPRNDPALLRLVRCEVLKPFGLGGGRIGKVGDVVELPRFDAVSMQALGRVRLL